MSITKANVRRLRIFNRWIIAAAGVVLQLALGAVYAWSVFRTPLVRAFGWSISEVTLTFTIAIFTLGVAAFAGGLWMRAKGPRIVGITGGALYGSGVFLASFSHHGLWVLYLTYGLIGGAGIGLGYIVPIATLVKWFPDRRGFITGIAVAGFGAGALVERRPAATRLIARTRAWRATFAIAGAAYVILVVVFAGACWMREPRNRGRAALPGGQPDARERPRARGAQLSRLRRRAGNVAVVRVSG